MRERDLRTAGPPGGAIPALVCAALVLLLPLGGALRAENIDPDGDGSQYAYGENVGWINAEPAADGGPGVEVGMFALNGWMWGENVGWISMSCENTSSCATRPYGVTNDGGKLAGYAWSENAGWISFSCENTSSCGSASYGVTIDTATGEFDGRAWAENLGWIGFASTGPNAFRMKTGWTCKAATAGPTLELTKSGVTAEMKWSGGPAAKAWDLVAGDLAALLATEGNFAAAVTGCIVDNEPGDSATDSTAPGGGIFYLVRSAECGGGTYDSSGVSQLGPRDGSIEGSASACP